MSRSKLRIQRPLRIKLGILVFCLLLLFLIISTTLLILGDFGYIPWSDHLHNLFIGSLIPDIAILAALIPWFHSLVTDKSEFSTKDQLNAYSEETEGSINPSKQDELPRVDWRDAPRSEQF